MKPLFVTLMALCVAIGIKAQAPVVIDLWPNGAPNESGLTGPETQLENGRIGNVTHPTLTVYPAKNPNGKVLIACPGGGYRRLAPNHEGHDMAAWLNNQGITLAVLKYRMPNGKIECPLSDGFQAIRILRERAAEFGIDPHQVGIMGASAGGNLATQLATKWTSADERPDFQVLFYATVGAPRVPDLMLGKDASPERIRQYTSVENVNAQTPPAFILCSADDPTVNCQNSIDYFMALRRNGISACLHIYPTGGHGWGFLDGFTYKREWTGELEKWLREN